MLFGILEKTEATMLCEEFVFRRRSFDLINVFSTLSQQLRQGLDVRVEGVVRQVSRCDLYVVYLQLDNKHDSPDSPSTAIPNL
jgi:hypothetical protein